MKTEVTIAIGLIIALLAYRWFGFEIAALGMIMAIWTQGVRRKGQ